MTARLVYIRKWPTFLTSCLASPFKLEARGRCHQSHSLVSTISPLSHGRVHWTSRNGKRRSQFATLKWKKQTKKQETGEGSDYDYLGYVPEIQRARDLASSRTEACNFICLRFPSLPLNFGCLVPIQLTMGWEWWRSVWEVSVLSWDDTGVSQISRVRRPRKPRAV